MGIFNLSGDKIIHQSIFITSMVDDLTFKRAARTKPIHFLTKPFNDIQLQRSIELSIQPLENSATETLKSDYKTWTEDILLDNHIYIKNRQKLEKVAIMNILYLEADGHYCQVHTVEKKYLVRLSMNDLAKKLPTELFFQTHRSFLVNLKKIQSVDLQDSVVVLPKGHIPLSKRNREVLLKKLDWI